MANMNIPANERWRVACHEAGHCVASLELGGSCDGAILTAAGGRAFVDGTHGDRDAWMIAAGAVSEALADDHSPPVCEPVTPEEIAAGRIESDNREFVTAAFFADVNAVPSTAKSDSRRLAEWSITGHEDQPEAWARRVTFAKRVAGQIVEANADAILRIARALYTAGKLTGDEITELLGSKQ